MPLDRRSLLGAGATLGGALLATAAEAAGPRERRQAPTEPRAVLPASEAGMTPDLAGDQTEALQRAIDAAAARRAPLLLPAGRYETRTLTLRPESRLIASAGTATLVLRDGTTLLSAEGARGIRLEGLALAGRGAEPTRKGAGPLVTLTDCPDLAITDLEIRDAAGDGLSLTRSGGRIADTRIVKAGAAGLKSLDATGLLVLHSEIADCADNGILVWRSTAGEDGTQVLSCRIRRIGAASGGEGQNGNGVNIFRAGSVLVTGNRITDCAFTAIRANAAPNVHMTGNSVARLGEVALYAEFGFEGALITSNLVDGAASGIAVTNFNEGGRLAVVQGNLVRNLFRRDHPVDKRGEGITVEADAAVTGNVVENAATLGIGIGHGPFMRDVVATGNLVRNAPIGIAVSALDGPGFVMIASNMISGARDGAIRAMDHGRPVGADLAKGGARQAGRVTVTGNVAS